MLAILKEISEKNEEAIKLYLQVIPIRNSSHGRIRHESRSFHTFTPEQIRRDIP